MNQAAIPLHRPPLNGFTFEDLQNPHHLAELDKQFLVYLKDIDPVLHRKLLAYRHPVDQSCLPNALTISQLIIDCAPILESFIGDLFDISESLEGARLATLSHAPIFAFKQWYVLKKARQLLHQSATLPPFSLLDNELTQLLQAAFDQSIIELDSLDQDRELAAALLGQYYLADPARHQTCIDKLVQWCAAALSTTEGRLAVVDWVSFKQPARLYHQQLIPLKPVSDDSEEQGHYQIIDAYRRQRDGFGLTDARMSAREQLNEIDYCIYCHTKEGDFCRKGFPQKKRDPLAGLKRNPLGEVLGGCPVDEKISEMHVLKREGYTLGALATIMADNPMCPATGHRICNDCMKSCIYQKQKPVDIPQIETGVLSDVLKLPWGVEIYHLLRRWNPLRAKQWVSQPYNGLKVLVMGMGPAGFSLAHHLLMEGFAVVGADGLKIEPLPSEWVNQPIYCYSDLVNTLDKRVVNGFGGVAEYGITVRWDKNFLSLIYLSLLREPHFQVFGDVRFGGTLTVDDVWKLGFDHLALAVGAGLPKALPIPGSLAPGMRQANDFLMALQLTGAAKAESLTNLQVRLPAVVIGGGLTGVDTATEVQAYYIAQIEKTQKRYQQLVDHWGETDLRSHFTPHDLRVLDEMLDHARAVQCERERAAAAGTSPDLMRLIQKWGGVTIVYRSRVQMSPAYRGNHEELAKALEEGIYYREALEPVEAKLDEAGCVSSLLCRERYQDEAGLWQAGEKTIDLPARSIFVATGAAPNIAYTYEHKGTFNKKAGQYQLFDERKNLGLVGVDQLPESLPKYDKSTPIGHFTSYQKNGYRVSVLGDTHPLFHGSVVQAIASAKYTYPAIVSLFKDKFSQQRDASESNNSSYPAFKDKINGLFRAEVVSVTPCHDKLTLLTVKAPLAALNFQPGQFYRVQSFESLSSFVKETRLQSEALALVAARVDKKEGLIDFIVNVVGASSRLVSTWTPGMPVSVMGPTGVRNKIPDTPQTILLISDELGLPQVCALGPALRQAGHTVLLLLASDEAVNRHLHDCIQSASDQKMLISKDKAEAALSQLIKLSPSTLSLVKRIVVTGQGPFVGKFQHVLTHTYRDYFKANPTITGSVYGPMQCMLKGVCAQCLQWQIDPVTGQRTKAVYACSWQDQPIQSVSFDHLDQRLEQNQMQETLTNLWLTYILSL